MNFEFMWDKLDWSDLLQIEVHKGCEEMDGQNGLWTKWF